MLPLPSSRCRPGATGPGRASRALALATAICFAAAPISAQTLPAPGLADDQVTVSGLSSGAYMAAQFHVAHSDSVAGAGVIAGGPWNCARGSVFVALWRCMETWWGSPDGESLADAAAEAAELGEIDPLDDLNGDRVYLFRGTEDETVTLPPVQAAEAFYLAAGIAPDDLAFVDDVAAGHAFITEDGPLACNITDPPFIADCDIDLAGEILGHLLPGLAPAGTADPARLMTFDQSAFLENPEEHGMGPEGFVYIPEACEAGNCRLHIAFAGCRQTVEDIGDLFARTAGYNDWAETNDLIILYPQSHRVAGQLFMPFTGNPKGCWDWWGYDDDAYATKAGRQIAAVAAMAKRLGAPGLD